MKSPVRSMVDAIIPMLDESAAWWVDSALMGGEDLYALDAALYGLLESGKPLPIELRPRLEWIAPLLPPDVAKPARDLLAQAAA